MKKNQFGLIGVAVLALAMSTIHGMSQTNTVTAESTNSPTTVDRILGMLDTSITNVAVEGYGTYAPKAPEKFGGGIFGAYNFNDYVGAGIGLDWLGSFNLVSGDVTLQAPFHVTTVFPGLAQYSFLDNLEVMPYARVGVATAYSGGGNFNGAATVDTAVGGFVKIGHVLGGSFDVGADFSRWQGSGPYDVPRYHLFGGWSYGF